MITATSMATGGSSSVFLSVPKLPSQKLQILSHKQVFFTNKKWSTLPFLCSSSTPLVEEENGSTDDVLPASINEESSSVLPPGACKGCGRLEIESGCNGEGRIQGGIATIPGFGWWPIKAYRPCPAFVASGGRYKRFGQSMDEVVSGKGGRVSTVGTDVEVQSSTKKNRTKRSKS
ncbi:uncharacterized protein [Solanum lycopersicum]|uniref:uncharacterized protein n=1 Tax=Solanum lycopersicum TaxID=4081 RepID=UPI000276C6C9|nr:uncharacterized protein LOC104648938 [Solanum lycopersicum]